MTYEYLCEACGHRWEAQQSISDAPLKDCPECGAARAKRQISRGGGFILKGGGWYSDLYSAPSAAKTSADTAPSSSTSSDGGSAKSATTSSDKPAPASASTANSATSNVSKSGD